MTTPTDTEKLAQALREMIDYYRGDRTEEPYVIGRAREALAAHESRAQPATFAPDWPDGPDREPPAQPASVAGVKAYPLWKAIHAASAKSGHSCDVGLAQIIDALDALTAPQPAKENEHA